MFLSSGRPGHNVAKESKRSLGLYSSICAKLIWPWTAWSSLKLLLTTTRLHLRGCQGIRTRRGSPKPFTGSEPAFGITETQVRSGLTSWMERHKKFRVTSPSKVFTFEVPKLSRSPCIIRKYLHNMDLYKKVQVYKLCNSSWWITKKTVNAKSTCFVL